MSHDMPITCQHASTYVVYGGIASRTCRYSLPFFSTLLVFNLIIASRILGEAVTPPKVAGALLILAGAGITTGATPQGVPKAHTPADVRALLFAPPPYGWLVPLLLRPESPRRRPTRGRRLRHSYR